MPDGASEKFFASGLERSKQIESVHEISFSAPADFGVFWDMREQHARSLQSGADARDNHESLRNR